jgi:WD40 repeat protein
MSNTTDQIDPLDAVVAAYLEAAERGSPPPRADVLAAHPHLAPRLAAFFADLDRVGPRASQFHLPSVGDAETVSPDRAAGALPVVRYVGDYELVEELARGGMGVVFRARQVSLNRPVAVKMILAGEYATPQAVQRFRAEAEAAAGLDHPNILPIHEVGEHAGHPYFSMKLVEGGTLAGKIDELGKEPKRTAELIGTLARAVEFAHRRGILHRDLKPGNVLLDADGTAYVTDFGLAKKVDRDDGSTRTGAVVGTPAYMAPEQARGEKGLTTAADVYSLGAVLYEILAGRPPFKGDTVFDTIKQVIETDPADPRTHRPAADRDLSVIALKCLSKDPAGRYATAGELADDLDRYRRGEPIAARPVGRVERTWKWVRRNPVVAGLTAALLLFIGSSAAALLLQYQQVRASRDDLSRTNDDLSEAVGKEREATARAGELLRESDTLRTLAEGRLYGSQVRLALSGLTGLQIGQARRALDEAAPARRGWEWHHLNAAVDTSTKTVKVQSSVSNYLRLSPDGKRLGVGTSHDELHSIDLTTGKFGRRLSRNIGGYGGYSVSYGHPMPCVAYTADQKEAVYFGVDGLKWHSFVEDKTAVLAHARPHTDPETRQAFMGAVCFSADAKRFYAAGRGQLACWDAAARKELWSLPISAGECWAVAVSADESRVAVFTKSDGGAVVVYDTATKKEVKRTGRLLNTPFLVQFSPDAKRLFTACSWSSLHIWDLETGKQLAKRATDSGHSAAVSADGKTGVVGLFNGDVGIVDLTTGETTAWLRGHTGHTDCVCISPDGSLAASGSEDKTIRLWDLKAKKHIRTLIGHTDRVTMVAFSDDGKTLLSGSGDDTVKWWPVADAGPTAQLPLRQGGLRALAWLKDGERLVFGFHEYVREKNGDVATVEVWNTVTATRERVIGPHGTDIHSLALSPDEALLLTGDQDGTAKVWDFATGKEVRTHHPKAAKDVDQYRGPLVKAVAFAPDGKRYATGKGNGELHVFDRDTGAEVWKGVAKIPQTWTTHYNGEPRMGDPMTVLSLRFTPDGRRLLAETHSWDDGVIAFDAATGAVVFESDPAKRDDSGYTLSVDGKTLVLPNRGFDDNAVQVVDLESGRVVHSFPKLKYTAATALSPDGRWLAVSGNDAEWQGFQHRIRLFDLTTKAQVATLIGHEDQVVFLHFLPGGRLVSGSYDHTVKVWDPSTAAELLSLPLGPRASDRVYRVEVSPDGKRIAATNGCPPGAGSAGNVVVVWAAK